MRILHLDTGTGWRGGQQQVLWLMEGVRQRGHQQWLAAPAGSPLADATRQQGLPVADLGSARRSLASVKALREIAPGFDILHAHDAHAHSVAWLAGAMRARRPWPRLVVSRRVAFPVGKFGGLKYAAADAYISISEYVRQQLLKTKVPPGKIHVIYDGVKLPSVVTGFLACPLETGEDACPTSSAHREFRSRFGLSESAPLIGTFTSLAPEKLLLEELELLEALQPPAQLWIGRSANDTGRQKTERVLIDYAQQHGLQNRFQILALADDLGKFLSSLDVFLYLSRSEGLGSAILLAMAYGLPVIASRAGGIPEIVRHQETGLLLRDHTSRYQMKQELIASVSLLLGSAQLRARLGSAARKFVMENATVELMVEKTLAVYEHVLQAPEQAPSARQPGIMGGRS